MSSVGWAFLAVEEMAVSSSGSRAFVGVAGWRGVRRDAQSSGSSAATSISPPCTTSHADASDARLVLAHDAAGTAVERVVVEVDAHPGAKDRRVHAGDRLARARDAGLVLRTH